ncbi:hypothetical protein CDD80_5902 [Ophiocordyceps camponoti-rufipedis]|uniref:Uncharacterized protein n=1 Tax=Ophiocordyceps camponoti-rufipedis TaxID=2004952 RepID=A0A2C5YU79_9HYPO|nr:hypothetical protein CDD80_5902 [Ophiocordyceps camponoti-rufipedis]
MDESLEVMARLFNLSQRQCITPLETRASNGQGVEWQQGSTLLIVRILATVPVTSPRPHGSRPLSCETAPTTLPPRIQWFANPDTLPLVPHPRVDQGQR